MNISDIELKFEFDFFREDSWVKVPGDCVTESGFLYRLGKSVYRCDIVKDAETGFFSYHMEFDAEQPTQLRFRITVPGEEDYFHLIPCNIYGDNNEKKTTAEEFPFLTRSGRTANRGADTGSGTGEAGERERPDRFASTRWEFRADRAAAPLSALAFGKGCAGISIDPYSDGVEGGIHWEKERPITGREERDGLPRLPETGETVRDCAYIHNGVFAELPCSFGVTLGYTNDPVTFSNRRLPNPPTAERACRASVSGSIYFVPGKGRMGIHDMVRAEYGKRHSRAEYEKDYCQAAAAMVDAFVHLNWNRETREYTNMRCRIPDDPQLKPWRDVCEIGWLGGAVLAYPLILSEYVEGAVNSDTFREADSGERIIDRIVEGYHPKSGFFHNLLKPNPGQVSRDVTGWAEKECHFAYLSGSAVTYILKSIVFLKSRGRTCPDKWLLRCRQVLDTVISLQREDGALGVAFSTAEKKVLDWEGFAGCLFVPGMAYCYRLTREEKYLDAAERALRYYRTEIECLDCYGTPLDTRKSVDQEGNIAFVRGCRLVYEDTGEKEFLEAMTAGAEYECLWRYGYAARPECPPLDNGWNSCGGSVTSVSNAHMHPMGAMLDTELRFLARVTGDDYYRQRAGDSTAWIMQNLEMYPDKTGYGRYGILSERWCPSDGLLTERYSDNTPCSTWLTYNLWAAACALEAVAERYLEGACR
ncbi:MAG: hypothetical protein NC420_07065 [Eubacterium sp.]|nr:hypothetical protein [Eubacterium sp.]MCM1304444.1 hypothetical protein [Butyrivibrio sp.]MCM1343899.1 hypothetical protein [Muribaculaceae bacterium]MCM1408941.1 hypothetical protein [Lachnospiraceae bacterium]